MQTRYSFKAALCAVCMVFGSLGAQAQNSDESLVFRVLTFDRVEGLKEIYQQSAGAVQSIKMHKNNFTGPYRSKTRSLVFYKKPPEKGKKPVLAGKVKVSESMGKRVILIAVPSAGEDYFFFPVADDAARFKAGGLKLINLSRVAIKASLNGKKTGVKSGGICHVARVSDKAAPHSYPVEFHYLSQKEWRPFTSSYWLHEPDVRNLVFCYPDPKSKRIRIKTIRDLPDVKEDE